MKAISVRQPWAELILQGKKTVEVRKLHTYYRGPLLIHAAVVRGSREFKKALIDPKLRGGYSQQQFVGIVDLIDVVKLNESLWEEFRDRHLVSGPWISEEYKNAWIIENPRRIEPIHFLGQPSIFSVEKTVIDKIKII